MATSTLPSSIRPLRESSVDEGDEILRRRLKKDGFLFFRGAVGKKEIARAYGAAIRACYRHAVSAGTKRATISSRFTQLTRKARKNLIERCRLDWLASSGYRAAVGSVKLENLMARVLGGEVVPHPRRLAQYGRIVPPSTYLDAIAPHQDIHYLRLPAESYTAWMGAGHCPLTLGGVALVQGSHRFGRLEHIGRRERAVLPRRGVIWSASSYAPGDVVIFHSQTVHMGLPNRTRGALRISIDVRFCRRDLFDPTLLSHPDFGNFA